MFFRHQKLLAIQFLVFAVFFGSVVVISAIVYNKTTIEKVKKEENKEEEKYDFFEKLAKPQG